MLGRRRLAAQGAGLRRVRHGRPTWRAMASLRKVDPAADLARQLLQPAAVAPDTAITAGWAARRIAPTSRAARRSSARASNAARSAASSNSEAWSRGRTIWRKPKPLTASARTAGAASHRPPRPAAGARPCPDCRQIDADRAADAVTPDRSARPPGAATASSAGAAGRRLDQGHRRGQRDAQLAAGEAERSRCALRRAGRTSRHRARAGGDVLGLEVGVRRAVPHRSTRASGRFHGSAPPRSSRVTSIEAGALGYSGRSLGQQIFPAIGDGDALRPALFSRAAGWSRRGPHLRGRCAPR